VISYVTIGTNDHERALAFFDAFLPEVGGARAFEAPSGQFYKFAEGALLGVFKPFDGQPATGGNGTMISFKVGSEDRVRDVHARALALGATDEGAPGPRGERGFYSGYFRDADGNKFCVYRM
jgi:catechol 2,3-dioxygenase-like lactoylglutathione lyase family enzyme